MRISYFHFSCKRSCMMIHSLSGMCKEFWLMLLRKAPLSFVCRVVLCDPKENMNKPKVKLVFPSMADEICRGWELNPRAHTVHAKHELYQLTTCPILNTNVRLMMRRGDVIAKSRSSVKSILFVLSNLFSAEEAKSYNRFFDASYSHTVLF